MNSVRLNNLSLKYTKVLLEIYGNVFEAKNQFYFGFYIALFFSEKNVLERTENMNSKILFSHDKIYTLLIYKFLIRFKNSKMGRISVFVVPHTYNLFDPKG